LFSTSDVEVVVGSDNIEKLELFGTMCQNDHNRAEINKVSSCKWNKEIKMGFELI
jgi:hypothetical protein